MTQAASAAPEGVDPSLTRSRTSPPSVAGILMDAGFHHHLVEDATMREKMSSRDLALATVAFAVIGSSACSRQDERLTAPTRPALSVSTPTTTQTYSWKLTWAGSAECNFFWNWQLADGTTASGGYTTCVNPSTGTGSIPPTATGIVVGGSLSNYTYGCNPDSKSVTKSLNGSGTTIQINLSITGTYLPLGFGVKKENCPLANAQFTLTTS